MMSRISQLKNHVRLLSVLTAAVLLWAVPSATQAAGYVYQQHTVNAGVVFVGSAGDATPDPAPYLFYVLNNRPDARPTDLTLVNPQAPPTVTQAILNRWPTATSTYTLGQAVTPNMAAYWEVPLHDLSSEELQQYDVLYLDAGGSTFSPADNEKLRRFVDSGGQLFVEYKAASGTPALFSGVTLATGAVTALSPPAASATALLRHPLISQPYLLSTSEISSLGDTAVTANLTGLVSSDYVNLFGPVLVHSTAPAVGDPTAVIAGQLGAGQIVASVLNIGGTISNGNGATFVPPIPPAVIPASDLKFLSNLIAWSETHPSEYKTSHGNASATGLSAFSTSWLYPGTTPPPAGTNPPPAATIWGNFVFVTDTFGTLHAFDAYPSENLLGGPTNDDGSIADFGGVPPTTYDQIWSIPAATLGTNASAPTVATYKGTTLVFVEKADGSILAYDAVTGVAPPLTFTPPTDANGFTAASYPAGGVTNAPSPTYYDGRLYAGQANGTLSIYDLNDSTSANIQLNPATTSGDTVTGPPSVGLLPNSDTNVVTAIVPTTNTTTSSNLYTVLLGARNEPLVAFSPANVLTGYSINRQIRYGLPNLVADTNAAAVPRPVSYDANGTVLGGFFGLPPASPNNPQDPLFAITEINSYFTDWDTDFAATAQNSPQTLANLNFISAATVGSLDGTPAITATFSTPAMDRRGDYYYTLNDTVAGTVYSYLIGVQNALLPSNVQIKFRFLIPATGLTDDDNVDYSQIARFKFVGAPVVDALGNVYAAATDGSNATVLCFKGNQGASADFKNKNTTVVDLTQVTFQQADEIATPTQYNGLTTGSGVNAQYTASTNQVTFFNFGKASGVSAQQIVGNLTEPQPVQAVPNDTTNAPATTTLSLHTNLSWFVTPFPVTGAVTGLSKVGNSLLLTDGTALYSLPASPTGIVLKKTSIAPSKTTLNLGTVGAPPSIGGSVMVINGTAGIGELTRQVTVVADNHRVLGVDSDGAAIWAVDATINTTTTGTSKVPFSHPVSLSQFADNQFLVADTGNNRCVRFDPSGNVQWELTRFTDPNGLMAPGQPDTLSQPTSVQPHIYPDPDTTNNPNGTVNSYLIADSGNDRIVEVTDRLTATGGTLVVGGVPQSHILTWVTHTGDQSGRRYRYGSATYFSSANGLSIAATVTNTRIGPLGGTPTAPTLGAPSSDAPGGCLVVFNPTLPQVAFSNNPPPANDLAYVAPGFYNAGGAAVTVKNPRFLQLYTPTIPPPVGTPPYSFLYADDNGAFDLTFDPVRNAFAVGTKSLQFTPDDYHLMTIPINAAGVAAGQNFVRTGLPFVPSSIQRFPADANGYPHYLITQAYSQGEVSGRSGSNYGVTGSYIPPGLGGEVFEVYYDTTTVTTSPTYHKFAGSGSYAGHTLSRPGLTGPLAQPTFAVRLP